MACIIESRVSWMLVCRAIFDYYYLIHIIPPIALSLMAVGIAAVSALHEAEYEIEG